MPIATLTNLSLAFGTDQILDRIELSIENGERIAFTGRNGAGKSTLLGIISGAVNEDGGNLWRAGNLKFVTLSQNLPERTEITVFDSVSGVFDELGKQLAEYHHLTEHMTGDNWKRTAYQNFKALLTTVMVGISVIVLRQRCIG